MGVDLLRGGGGRGHFLIACFALLSLFLLFNWWSLSTENLDLLKQIDDLSQHMKSSSNLLDQCRRDRSTLEGRVKRLEEDNDKLVQTVESEKQTAQRLEGNLKESNKETLASEKKFDGANTKWKMCVTELDSLKKVDIAKSGTIDSMRIEKTDLTTQIQELKDQVAKLESQLKEKVENAPKKTSSSTAAVPQKVENDAVAENEVRNIPEPYHAEEKESEHRGDHLGDKDDQAVDERELEMQGNGDERKGSIA
ncbi:myosin-2 heavy chain, non muscle-like [Thrips palmi]|uniref:Myosin-2 heavy chain, non muscle-like n=1 Tax=Thrips palmi TaxID=161013 RepID=A0A6P8ZB10_THRPL|nr:myosin-2 heavy chain, non muscle-like [Thrips palmi]